MARMVRRPITREEKIESRFERRDRSVCWLWDGDTDTDGRPRLGYQKVMRIIFEQEFGPIPPGYVLWRDDHTAACRPAMKCRHLRCVNPHHVRLVKSWGGLYERDNRKKGRDAVEGYPEDHDESADAGRSS
jgi:hypothetical protein